MSMYQTVSHLTHATQATGVSYQMTKTLFLPDHFMIISNVILKHEDVISKTNYRKFELYTKKLFTVK